MKLKTSGKVQRLIVLVIVLISIPLSIYQFYLGGGYLTKAVTVPASMFFLPSSINLNPDGNLKLVLDARQYSVKKIRVKLSFDRTKFHLSDEVTTTGLFSRIYEKSTMSQANSSGNIIIFLEAEAGGYNGVREIAVIPLQANKDYQGGGTSKMELKEVEVIDINGSRLALDTFPASVVVPRLGFEPR